jgi:hydroxyacylglutathione hydrolase
MPGALSPEQFAARSRDGLVLDVRHPSEFTQAHLPGSLSIFAGQNFAIWLGWLVNPNMSLFIVPGERPLSEVLDESLLVGYERFGGYLEGGLAAWTQVGLALDAAEFVTPDEARDALDDGAVALDVREPNEFAEGHIEGALHIPLGKLGEQLDHVPRGRPIITYCAHGPRATSALSILERAGIGPLLNLRGGYEVWAKSQPVAV